MVFSWVIHKVDVKSLAVVAKQRCNPRVKLKTVLVVVLVDQSLEFPESKVLESALWWTSSSL